MGWDWTGLDWTGWTGSLNGLTIRAPNGANKINSLLYSDVEIEQKKPSKPKVLFQGRASVSCNTPPNLALF